MRRRPNSNRNILVSYFWGHADFCWSPDGHIFDLAELFRRYRENIAKLTRGSLELMNDLNERQLVHSLLSARYGPELIPSRHELLYPDPTSVNDLSSWRPVFSKWAELTGGAIGVARRTGSDVRKYKTAEIILEEPSTFEQVSRYQFRSVGRELVLNIYVQEFPREHLYRVQREGATVLEFDDWPDCWTRSWSDKAVHE